MEWIGCEKSSLACKRIYIIQHICKHDFSINFYASTLSLSSFTLFCCLFSFRHIVFYHHSFFKFFFYRYAIRDNYIKIALAQLRILDVTRKSVQIKNICTHCTGRSHIVETIPYDVHSAFLFLSLIWVWKHAIQTFIHLLSAFKSICINIIHEIRSDNKI